MFNLKMRAVTFLRWSETYTKTDMVYLASGGFLSLVSQVTALAGALALAVMVSHYVPKTSYGEYKYILSIVALLSSFSLNGIGGAVLQSSAQGYNGALQVGFWTNLRWSFVVFIGAFGAALYYLWAGNTTFAAEILIGGTLSPLIASATLFSPFLAGKKDFVHQTLFSIGDNLIPIGLMIGTVLLTSSPLALVAVYFVSNALAALFFYRRTQIMYAQRVQTQDKSMVRYSKHLSAMGILGGISENIDQVLLFHFVGGAQLAIYNFAIALPNQMKTPIKNIDAMLQARFVHRTAREIKDSMWNKIFWFFAAMVTVAAVYILIAPYVFRLLFPQYLESVRYSQIFVLWILPFAFDPFTTYLNSRKNLSALYTSTISYSLSRIAFIFFGAFFWGLMGAIIAKVATQFVAVGYNYALYRKVLRADMEALTVNAARP
jgi:O-antigen/teichoic acid export membrane protein